MQMAAGECLRSSDRQFGSFFFALLAAPLLVALVGSPAFAGPRTTAPAPRPLAVLFKEACERIQHERFVCARLAGLPDASAAPPEGTPRRMGRAVIGQDGFLRWHDPQLDALRAAMAAHPESWIERNQLVQRALAVWPDDTLLKFEWDLLIDALFMIDSKGQSRLEELAAARGASNPEGLYLAESPYALWTSYEVLQDLFRKAGPWLPAGASVADLGSGLGRIGFFLAVARPDLRVVGYEFDESRARAANSASARLGLAFRTVVQDLSKGALPVADAYYLHNPFGEETSAYVRQMMNEEASVRRFLTIALNNVKRFGIGRSFENRASGTFPKDILMPRRWDITTSRGRRAPPPAFPARMGARS